MYLYATLVLHVVEVGVVSAAICRPTQDQHLLATRGRLDLFPTEAAYKLCVPALVLSLCTAGNGHLDEPSCQTLT